MNLCCTPHPNMEGGYDVTVMHLLVAPRGEVVRRGKIIVLHIKIFNGDVYENVTSKYNFSLLEVVFFFVIMLFRSRRRTMWEKYPKYKLLRAVSE